jgi:predicted deacylase
MVPESVWHHIDVDADVALDIAHVSGHDDGPTVALLGGVHGDEDEGVVAIRRLLHLLSHKDVRGRVIAVPVSNPPAFAARSRTSPLDELNLARAFPGDPDGSPTERIAHVITDHVIRRADVLIDLHSAGADFAMPLFCGFHDLGTEASRVADRLARDFGTPLIWAHGVVSPGRSLSVAAEEGIPGLYVEGSGGGQIRGPELEVYTSGVLNVMRRLGSLDGPVADPPPQRIIVGGIGNVDSSATSPADGSLVTWLKAGDPVKEGSLIASVIDADGELAGEVRSPSPGIVMFLRRNARVREGEPIVLIGPPPEDA